MIIFVIRSLKGQGWNNVGPASQTVAQHYISIGPMYRVICVVAFQATGLEKSVTRIAMCSPSKDRTGQSPVAVSISGQRSDIGPTLGEWHVISGVLPLGK